MALNQRPPVFILVEPQLGRNIGQAARAMLNFEFTELRLVKPVEGWLNDNTRALSAGADEVLDSAQIYPTLSEAVSDLHVLYGTSARLRHLVQTVMTPHLFAKKIVEEYEPHLQAGIVFGREKYGLTNDEMALMHAVIQIPANETFSSLNLSQAILLIAYEWYQAIQSGETLTLKCGDSPLSNWEERIGFLTQLETELDHSGYFRADHKRPIMMRNLKNIFSRVPLTSQEVRTLRGVISHLVNPHGIYSRKKRSSQ